MVSDSSSSTILKTAFVHCKADNVSRNTACDFVNSIIVIALLVLLQKPDLLTLLSQAYSLTTQMSNQRSVVPKVKDHLGDYYPLMRRFSYLNGYC